MVGHKKGIARNQVAFICLEDLISQDNTVRVIDAFVDILNFEQLGFAHIKPKQTGAPAYHPALMLRIYLYGYLNRIRSSRKLEVECYRNIEMQWLTEQQKPCYRSIAGFRTYKQEIVNKETGEKTIINHLKALKEVFRALNRFLNGEGLFGKETVASDGTKIRAQNAKKKNYTLDKLDKKIQLSDANIENYLQQLDELDQKENKTQEQEALQQGTIKKLEELREWNTKFKDYKKDLVERQALDPDITQISVTDPDARSIVINNSGHAEVSYNIVTAVDDKHCLIADYLTENIKDTTLLADSMIAVKAEFDNNFEENLHKNIENTEGGKLTDKLDPKTKLNGLADKGFHATTQIHQCTENNIITYVAIPQLTYSGKDKDFTINNFSYNQTEDTFTCPNNQTLTNNGNWYEKKNRRGQVVNKYKRYGMSPKTCSECPFAEKCLSKTSIKYRVSRQLERAEGQESVVANKNRLDTQAGKDIYKRRQAIVEHPFGIWKRQWDCSYTLLKGIDKVNAEFAIVCTCYNMRRAITIKSAKSLIELLKSVKNKTNTTVNRFFSSIIRHLNNYVFFSTPYLGVPSIQNTFA
ncbi:MAG: IS1182 family transposase [Saprospiraceae bacterium]|nr:IS1182 family transposase [Saprospiraceae bacterium]